MKRFFAEFREFINKGNLVAIAVAFVLGIAFAAVVSAFVESVFMPIIAIPFGEPSFDDVLEFTVNDAVIRVGVFLTALVNFLLVAFVVFLVLKAYNRLTKGEATAPAGDLALLGSIRDELQGLRADLAGRSGPTA